MGTYKAFLVDSLAAEACSDRSADRSYAIKSFSLLNSESGRTNAPDISESELKPRSKGAAADDPVIVFDPRLFPLLQKLNKLKAARTIATQRSLPTGDQQPDSDDVREIISYALSASNTSNPCHLCQFEGQAFAFFELVNVLPPGQDLERSFGADVDFLSHNHMQEEDPVAYLLVLKQLINIARPVSEKMRSQLAETLTKRKPFAEIPTEEAGVLSRELQRSNDPIIGTYMGFERLFHPKYALPDLQH